MKLTRILLALAMLGLAQGASAQVATAPSYNSSGGVKQAQGVIILDASGAIEGTNANPVATAPAYIAPTSWSPPTTAIDARAYGTFTITATVAPATPYTIQWSPDGTTWLTATAVGLDYSTTSTISAVGRWTMQAGGYVRLGGTGSGGTFFYSAGQ